MEMKYFLMACGALLIAGFCFFGVLASLDTPRLRNPKLAIAFGVSGVAFVGLSLWLLTL
ncbi:hypothetical protein OHS71_11295 [Streptomyces sp. NBC_00377]|uniref:hypothetical protein n=1 Tax=unclassified Streptomyces TaxID=2593676 RepID=UPI000A443BF7|nr:MULTISPECIES: hypothetical protein [unclassified Streptomyces]